MGAKSWMLVYHDTDVAQTLASKPTLNRAESTAFAKDLFPRHALTPIDDGTLLDTAPRGNDVYVGCYPGVSIVAAEEFGIDYPSKLPVEFLDPKYGESVCLHAMHSVVDWFAFAIWHRGKLVRALSLSPDSGILEDIGEKQDFERPYWTGQYPAIEPEDDDPDAPYPFAFHPLDLGEALLASRFGYQREGNLAGIRFEPEEITLLGFKRQTTKWWKFW